MITPLALEKALSIRCDLGDAETQYYTDPKLLRQILLNVLSNAVKYNRHDGSILVALSSVTRVAANQASDPAYVITVSDTGEGMFDTALAVIFQPFGQALADTLVASGGIGLGLPLSARIAELLGGALEVSSEEGRGTDIALRLPIESANASDGPQA